jgi:hypothetical protein
MAVGKKLYFLSVGFSSGGGAPLLASILADRSRKRNPCEVTILFVPVSVALERLAAGWAEDWDEIILRRCPVCEKDSIVGHGRRRKQAHDEHHDWIRIRRSRCGNCGMTFTFLSVFSLPYTHYSLRARWTKAFSEGVQPDSSGRWLCRLQRRCRRQPDHACRMLGTHEEKDYRCREGCAEIACAAVDRVRALYAIERQAKDASAEDRLKLRQSQSAPLLTQLRERLLVWKEQLLPKHPMAEAIHYALGQRNELNVFCSDGAVPFDNNVSEREMKRVVLNRKNSLFIGNPRGGRAAAILASLTSTCRRHDIDPQRYLTQLLINLPSTPIRQLSAWLPNQWKQNKPPPSPQHNPCASHTAHIICARY